MADKKDKKESKEVKSTHHNQNSNVPQMAAGVAGAVIGAGMGVMAAKALSDKDTREKIQQVVSDVKDQIAETLQEAGERAAEVKGNVAEKIDEQKKDAKRLVTK